MERNYTLDYSKPDEAARTTLQMHIDTLESFRRTTPHPEELDWEIRVYKFMQDAPNPAEMLKQYQDARYDENDLPAVSKRDALAKLGWVIPEGKTPVGSKEK